MRCSTSGHRGGRVAVHGIGRMSRSVIGDDRGPIVVGAEVQSGAGILPDVDLVGEPADFLPCPLTAGSCLLDFIGYRAATTNLCLGMRHRKPRDLARDRP